MSRLNLSEDMVAPRSHTCLSFLPLEYSTFILTFSILPLGEDAALPISWPPQDPEQHEPNNYDHLQSSSPWTYGHDALNPALEPTSSSRRRFISKSHDSRIPHDKVPPYHPDYDRGEKYQPESHADDSSLSSSDVEDDVPLGVIQNGESRRVRRGSEGYEMQAVSREQMLRQYLESVGKDYDKYIRYIPEVESEYQEVDLQPHASTISG